MKGVSGPLMLWFNIPPPVCESRLLALPAPAQTQSCLWAQLTLVRVEYVQRKIAWSERIEPKTSALVSY
jgi:hypothetical protein